MKSCTRPLVSLLALAALLLACSNQSEGQPCSVLSENGGNDDCAPGLSCQTVNGLELCCPVPPKSPTVPECVPAATLPEGGVEASTDDVVSTDAGTDDTSATTD